MGELKTSGEAPCQLRLHGHQTQLVVITGGPGAGKTALLEFVRKIYCQHVAILPEAASILFGGGFWRMESQSARISAQMAIFHVQSEMEKLVIGERQWLLGLCDRGTLDGLAYWKASEDEFFEKLGTSKQSELEKYAGVLHLTSPSESMGYNRQNPIRNETAQAAEKIDRKINDIWSQHPNYTIVHSTESFIEKLQWATAELGKLTQPILGSHQREDFPP